MTPTNVVSMDFETKEAMEDFWKCMKEIALLYTLMRKCY